MSLFLKSGIYAGAMVDLVPRWPVGDDVMLNRLSSVMVLQVPEGADSELAVSGGHYDPEQVVSNEIAADFDAARFIEWKGKPNQSVPGMSVLKLQGQQGEKSFASTLWFSATNLLDSHSHFHVRFEENSGRGQCGYGRLRQMPHSITNINAAVLEVAAHLDSDLEEILSYLDKTDPAQGWFFDPDSKPHVLDVLRAVIENHYQNS